MAKEITVARERDVSKWDASKWLENAYRKGVPTLPAQNNYNERKLKETYGLRYRPDRVSSLETAKRVAQISEKKNVVVQNKTNNKHVFGYYLATPRDASKLIKKAGFKLVETWVK